jgi:hypothetical protein
MKVVSTSVGKVIDLFNNHELRGYFLKIKIKEPPGLEI